MEIAIKFNGNYLKTSINTTHEFFKAHSGGENEVWILNGFATKENLEINDGDELFCISKGVLPPQDALDSMMRARHTPKLHDKLKQSTIAVCGLGGLGSHIAIMLARSGIGKLILFDFDIVEPSNLNRQSFYVSDLGLYKSEAIGNQIKTINPYTQIKLHTLRITRDNIGELFGECNVVCEAFDTIESKSMIMQNFHKCYPNKILICASGIAGYGDSNSIQTHKIADNFYVCGDLKNGAKVGKGLMSPRVTIAAAHQANLVLELLAQ